jgi:thiol:disulfide interchange protein DsbC
MLKTYSAVLATFALLLLPAFAAADNSNSALVLRKGPEAVILEKLQQARPEITFGQPQPSPIDGLYQVQVPGGPTLYVTPEGDKFIAGELFSIDSGGFSRYEDPAVAAERKRMLATLDSSKSIIFKPKDKTKAVVYVFTDIDCGYCRLLHRQLHTYNDGGRDLPGYNDLGIEIRYLAYPRAGIPSGSADKLITAWCSKDPQKTLTALKNSEAVSSQTCDHHPVAEDFRLGISLGISGTPALWFPDGRVMPGYLPPADLARALGI